MLSDTAHKTYRLPADFMVLEERPCMGIKIDWSSGQGCCGLFTYAKENSYPFEGNTAVMLWGEGVCTHACFCVHALKSTEHPSISSSDA